MAELEVEQVGRVYPLQPLTPALSPEYGGEEVRHYFFFSIGGAFTSRSNSFGFGSS